jgi:hypothetical protein
MTFFEAGEASHLVRRWRCLPCRFREFDVKLFRRKRFLLRNNNSATAPSNFFIFFNHEHKKLIEIPPYYIDTLVGVLLICNLAITFGLTCA